MILSFAGLERVVELVGVGILLGGALWAALNAVVAVVRGQLASHYRDFRERLGRSILLGLEVLIIADIIGTAAHTPTLDELYVLGLIVLIRTFLSFALEIEMSGRLPWRREEEQAPQ